MSSEKYEEEERLFSGCLCACGLMCIRYLESNLCCGNQSSVVEKVGSVKSES